MLLLSPISSSNNGCNACSFTCWNVGAMMKNVKNNAKPTMTWFGGIWFVASAVRINDNTMTIRANDVINIKILGAKDKNR